MTSLDRTYLSVRSREVPMNVPEQLKHLDPSPVAVVAAVVIAVTLAASVAVAGLPSGRTLFVSVIGLFVLAMVLLDLWQRD